MQFFKFKDYAKSWSTWVFALFTTAPVIEHFTGLVSAAVPPQYQPAAVAVLGAVGMVVRAIKQK